MIYIYIYIYIEREREREREMILFSYLYSFWDFQHWRFLFGFPVLWHINLRRLSHAKTILLEDQSWYYLTHSERNKGLHTPFKRISPKVDLIAWLEFELAHDDATVLHFSHYWTGSLRLRKIFQTISLEDEQRTYESKSFAEKDNAKFQLNDVITDFRLLTNIGNIFKPRIFQILYIFKINYFFCPSAVVDIVFLQLSQPNKPMKRLSSMFSNRINALIEKPSIVQSSSAVPKAFSVRRSCLNWPIDRNV